MKKAPKGNCSSCGKQEVPILRLTTKNVRTQETIAVEHGCQKCTFDKANKVGPNDPPLIDNRPKKWWK